MRPKTKAPAIVGSLLALAAFAISAALAAENSASQLITHETPSIMPGLGRILFGFLVTVGLAFGVVYGLKRWLPRFSNRYATTSGKQVAVHTTVHGGLRVHVVTVDEQTVLVAEGKTGIAITVLPAASRNPPSSVS